MKLRSLFATISLGAMASVTSVHAQTIDPCTIYLCMAAISGYGTGGDPNCAAAILYWHAVAPAGLAVYDDPTPPYFDSSSSASLRRTTMSQCKGSKGATNAAILQAIITEYGYLP
jgi:hypothetical protein